jgi:hypothetical protein
MLSVELLLVEGREWEDRREVLAIAGEKMGGSLRLVRFAGSVVAEELSVTPEVSALRHFDDKATSCDCFY